jgi:hypothetical protein
MPAPRQKEVPVTGKVVMVAADAFRASKAGSSSSLLSRSLRIEREKVEGGVK